MMPSGFEADTVWKSNNRGFQMGAIQPEGVVVHLTGQVAWNAEETIVGKGDVEAQTRQIFKNIAALLQEVGGTLSDIVSVTTYFTDRNQLPIIQKVRTETFEQGHEPVSTSIMVAGLGHEDFLVELTPIAVIPHVRYVPSDEAASGAGVHRALVPDGSQAAVEAIQLSPGVISGDHVFVTGMTGSLADGSMPTDLNEQFRSAFDKIEAVLAEANLDFGSVVDMTTYHVDLRDHFDAFCKVRSDYVFEPYPAWTAVEVADLRREGAVVEIKVVARKSSNLKRKSQ